MFCCPIGTRLACHSHRSTLELTDPLPRPCAAAKNSPVCQFERRGCLSHLVRPVRVGRIALTTHKSRNTHHTGRNTRQAAALIEEERPCVGELSASELCVLSGGGGEVRRLESRPEGFRLPGCGPCGNLAEPSKVSCASVRPGSSGTATVTMVALVAVLLYKAQTASTSHRCSTPWLDQCRARSFVAHACTSSCRKALLFTAPGFCSCRQTRESDVAPPKP